MTTRALALALATLLPVLAFAAAPAGQYATTADTVLDNRTGLTWQRTASRQTATWDDAVLYCQTLSLGGQTGWRLPRNKELRSLVDSRDGFQSFDQTAFQPGDLATTFWSATLHPTDGSKVRVIHFRGGFSAFRAKTELLHVRCVR